MHIKNKIESGKPLLKAKKAIVFLHGRGGTAQGISELSARFATEDFYVVAPQATNNTWYPYGFMADESSNQPWLTSAVDWVTEILADVAAVVGSENVYLIGFSQGACLTLEVAGRSAMKFAGIAAFTGGIIGDVVVSDRYQGDFKGTPVYIGNSDNDPHVPVVRSEVSKQILESLGAKVTLEIFNGRQHVISENEIESVTKLMF